MERSLPFVYLLLNLALDSAPIKNERIDSSKRKLGYWLQEVELQGRFH